MYNLILDTSTEKGIIIISKENHVLFSLPLSLKAVKGSALLISSLQQVFNTFAISSLKAIAVATGPGSFTGIRVAAAFAKGLAIGRSLPLISFCSLLGYVSYEEGPFASIFATKMGGAYVLKRFCRQGMVEETSQPEFVPEGTCHLDRIVSPKDTFPCPNFLAQRIEKMFIEKKFSVRGELEMFYLNPELW